VRRRTFVSALALALPGSAIAASAVFAREGVQDQALTAFLDAAFDETTALSPQSMTSLGIKTDYDRLDDYTDAGAQKRLAVAERQLAEMKAKFRPGELGPAGQLSYRLFERQVEQQRESFRWRLHGYIALAAARLHRQRQRQPRRLDPGVPDQPAPGRRRLGLHCPPAGCEAGHGRSQRRPADPRRGRHSRPGLHLRAGRGRHPQGGHRRAVHRRSRQRPVGGFREEGRRPCGAGRRQGRPARRSPRRPDRSVPRRVRPVPRHPGLDREGCDHQ